MKLPRITSLPFPRHRRRRVAAIAAASAVVTFLVLSDVETHNGDSVRRLASSDRGVGGGGGGRSLSPPSFNVVSVPLVPHRALLDRRLRELGGGGSSNAEEEEELRGGGGGERRYARRTLSPPSSSSSPTHQQVDALYQGYGTHYVDLWIGSPIPQRQTVIVDTGSSVTAFPCSDCVGDCGDRYHAGRRFRESDSVTFRKVGCDEGCEIGTCLLKLDEAEGGGWTCGTRMSYAEGSSWLAYEGRDLAYVGGPHSEPLPEQRAKEESGEDGDDGSDVVVVDGADPTTANDLTFELSFGCQTSLTGLFRTQLADGILGMDADRPSLWRQMSDRGALLENEFALCFGRASIADRGGTEAGAMTMGGVDERLHSHPMVFASMTFSDPTNENDDVAGGWYVVTLRRMYLRSGAGDGVVPVENDDAEMILLPVDVPPEALNNGKVIVDSGTTDTYLSAHLRRPFSEAWENVAGTPFTNDPVHLSDEEAASLPTILIQLSGLTGDDAPDLPPDSPSPPGLAGDLDSDHPNDVLIAILPLHYMEYSPSTDKYACRFYFNERSGGVLGANAMMGHDVLFDVEGRRMGFAESDCDYEGVVSEAATKEEKRNRAG